MADVKFGPNAPHGPFNYEVLLSVVVWPHDVSKRRKLFVHAVERSVNAAIQRAKADDSLWHREIKIERCKLVCAPPSEWGKLHFFLEGTSRGNDILSEIVANG